MMGKARGEEHKAIPDSSLAGDVSLGRLTHQLIDLLVDSTHSQLCGLQLGAADLQDLFLKTEHTIRV